MIQNCCYCFSLKTGGLLIGAVEGFCGLVTFFGALFALDKTDKLHLEHEKWAIRVFFFSFVLLLGFFTALTSLLLIVGILKKKAKLLVIWLIFTIFSTFIYMMYSLCRSFNPMNMLFDGISVGVDLYFCYVVLALYEEIRIYNEYPESQVLYTRTETAV